MRCLFSSGRWNLLLPKSLVLIQPTPPEVHMLLDNLTKESEITILALLNVHFKVPEISITGLSSALCIFLEYLFCSCSSCRIRPRSEGETCFQKSSATLYYGVSLPF